MNDDTTHTDRDDCYFCGSDEQLETHHILPRRFSGSGRDRNLVDLCKSCHVKIERLYDTRFFHHFPILETPEFIDHHDAEIGVVENERFGPDSCSNCRRLGPFKDVRPSPNTVKAWECVRCGHVIIDITTVSTETAYGAHA